MTQLSQPYLQQLQAILQQLLPAHAISAWQDQTGLMGDIAEFDSMALANLLAAIEAVFDVEIDESNLAIDDFATWGTLQAYVAQLLRD